MVQQLAVKGGQNAIVALGVVIQGATPHADLINGQVSRALSGIALDKQVPVINSVVCADNLEQAIERCGTKGGNKGWSGALAAIEINTMGTPIRKIIRPAKTPAAVIRNCFI